MASLLTIALSEQAVDQWSKAIHDAGLSLEIIALPSVEEAIAAIRDVRDKHYEIVVLHIERLSEHTNQNITDLKNYFEHVSFMVSTGSHFPLERLHHSTRQQLHAVFSVDNTESLVISARTALQLGDLSRQLKSLEQRLQVSNVRHQQLIDTSTIPLAYISGNHYLFFNNSYMDLLGYLDKQELINTPIHELVSSNYKSDFQHFIESHTDLDRQQEISVECRRVNAKTFEARLLFQPYQYENQDCIELQIENLELEHRSRQVDDRDPQTGLFNRQRFMHDTKSMFTQKDPELSQLNLLYILLDNFEEMKSLHGLIETDRILQEIAQLLKSCLKQQMTIYRYGDHAFTILFESKNQQLAKVLSETLIRTINQYELPDNSANIPPTLSIGYSMTSLEATENAENDLNNLLEQAYQACREIYNNAGNGFVSYETLSRLNHPADSVEEVNDAAHLRELLTYALEHDRFRLLYQPIISIQGNTMEYYSVLLRLLDKNNEEISPLHFIRQAMHFDLMTEIDRWVIKRSITELARQRLKGSRINFFVQLSESAITDDSLIIWIVDCLREANVKGAWLTFQFHYTDLRNNMTIAGKLIQGLKKINCKVALNQYSNSRQAQQLLDRLGIDVIRLSKSMISEIQFNEQQQNEFLELKTIAHEKQVQTIATDIESEEVLETLWDLGINYIQGGLLREPSSHISFEN